MRALVSEKGEPVQMQMPGRGCEQCSLCTHPIIGSRSSLIQTSQGKVDFAAQNLSFPYENYHCNEEPVVVRNTFFMMTTSITADKIHNVDSYHFIHRHI